MKSAFFDGNLIERLPPVRGRLTANAPLAPVTWFGVGGPAEVLFKPADPEDLVEFLLNRPSDVPVIALGVGSNLLVRDGGVPGVVVRLGRAFAAIEADGTSVITGAAALDLNVAQTARNAAIGGLEFLSGIPGTIGGALRMNAGAFGREIRTVFQWAESVDATGRKHSLSLEDMGFSYRHCSVPDDHIFLRACLKGVKDDPVRITEKIAQIRKERESTQPSRVRTGGSTFANPDGYKAWQLIDAAGCRGMRRGDAMVSEKHCNFLLNVGRARAADLEALGEDIRRRVFETSGVTLEWEIRRIGIPGAKGDEA